MAQTKKRQAPRGKRVAAKVPPVRAQDQYILRLFVAGATTRSRQAILHVRHLCETTLKGRVQLEVVDIYQRPELTREHEVVATPTLILKLPLPVRRFIGNLNTIANLFALLDIGEKGRITL